MGIKIAVSPAFACVLYLDGSLFEGGYFEVFALQNPGSQIIHCHLNLSHRSSLCWVTSFFEIQGPYLIFAALSKKAFLIFGESLKCHVHCANVLALFLLRTCTMDCSITQVETMITKYLR